MKQTNVKQKYASEKQIASLLDIPIKLLRLLTKIGLPKIEKDKFIPKDCIKWYINYLRISRAVNKKELRINTNKIIEQVITTIKPK